MLNRLPELIDPFQSADHCREYKGTLAFTDMKRLVSLLVETNGNAELDIQFDRDSAGLAIANGTVSAKLRLQCQRCLEPLDYKVNSQFTLGVVASLSEARYLPEDYEPLVTEKDHIRLSELVEDEILLALPAIAMHAEQCSIGAREGTKATQRKAADMMYNAPTAGHTAEGKPHPFAVLADLKDKLSK